PTAPPLPPGASRPRAGGARRRTPAEDEAARVRRRRPRRAIRRSVGAGPHHRSCLSPSTTRGAKNRTKNFLFYFGPEAAGFGPTFAPAEPGGGGAASNCATCCACI